MKNETLEKLLQQLDEAVPSFGRLDAYYGGTQPLAFLAPEARTALGNRFGRMSSNICRLAVTSLSERLRVTGFAGVDVWGDWLHNDLDQTAGIAHREALTLGRAFVLVWADGTGRPRVTVESPRQVMVATDPGSRQITAAVKRWETATTTEAVLFEPDQIRRFRADRAGATIGGFNLVESIPNPLGVVPVVAFRNTDRLLDPGASELTDLIPLVDALNKVLADMLVTSEFFARPRRWATGIEMVETEVHDAEGNVIGMEETSPIPEGDRAMISEAADARFGQLPAADMGTYEKTVNVLLGQIMAVSALPAHYVGVFSDNPASADALRASEASLTARAEARQATFGRSWEGVARLVVAVRDGVDPARVEARVKWAEAATRSVAQEADAVVKLHQAGLLPADYALARIGYSADEIIEIRKARRTEALDSNGVDLTKVVA